MAGIIDTATARETSETAYYLLKSLNPTIMTVTFGLIGLVVSYRLGISRARADMRLQELTTIINELSERMTAVLFALNMLKLHKDQRDELIKSFGEARYNFYSYYALKKAQLGNEVYGKLERLFALFQQSANNLASNSGRSDMFGEIGPLIDNVVADLEARRSVWLKKDNVLKRAVHCVRRH